MEGPIFGGANHDQTVLGHLDAATYTSDATILEGRISVGDESNPTAARELAGQVLGVDPERIAIDGLGARGVGSRASTRTTIGFGGVKWNSSWTPARNRQSDPAES